MADEPRRFSVLPARIRVEDAVAAVDVRAVPGPEGGRDPQRAFVVRYGFPLFRGPRFRSPAARGLPARPANGNR